MFLGHYAVAIGAKRAAPRASLGTLIAAAAFLDLVWPVLVLLGLERVVVMPAPPHSRRSTSSTIRSRTAS